jgi:hypothetical protein
VITREEAVRLLEGQHAELATLLSELDDDAFVRRGTIGGGGWSAKDLAAHMGIWEEFAIETIRAFALGERPADEDRFTGPGAGDRVNDEGVRRFLDASAADVRRRFDDLHRGVVASIEATSDETWTSAYPYHPDDDTLGERIGSLLGSDDGGFTHGSAHLPDLRAYVDATRR